VSSRPRSFWGRRHLGRSGGASGGGRYRRAREHERAGGDVVGVGRGGHRTKLMSTSGQASVPYAHRPRKGQPGGKERRSGGEPGCRSARAVGTQRGKGVEQAFWCRVGGAHGASPGRAHFHHLPAYITATRLASSSSGTGHGYEEDRKAQASSALRPEKGFRAGRRRRVHVVVRSMMTTSGSVARGHGDHYSLAHAPDSSWGSS